jgi:hypothetical protein
MIASLKRFWSQHVIVDCPPELDACESCDWRLAIHCTERQAATCNLRREAIESHQRERNADAIS